MDLFYSTKPYVYQHRAPSTSQERQFARLDEISNQRYGRTAIFSTAIGDSPMLVEWPIGLHALDGQFDRAFKRHSFNAPESFIAFSLFIIVVFLIAATLPTFRLSAHSTL